MYPHNWGRQYLRGGYNWLVGYSHHWPLVITSQLSVVPFNCQVGYYELGAIREWGG